MPVNSWDTVQWTLFPFVGRQGHIIFLLSVGPKLGMLKAVRVVFA